MNAFSVHEVRVALRERSIEALTIEVRRPYFAFLRKKSTLSTEELISFFDALALMLEEGIEVGKVLDILASYYSEHDRLASLLAAMQEQLKQGRSLSAAFASGGMCFSPFMVTLINVGELSGTLPQSARMISQYVTQKRLMHQQIRSASLMPLLTLFFALLVVLIMSLVVVPRFEEIMNTFQQGKQLEGFIFSLSRFLRSWGLAALLCLSAAVAFVVRKRKAQMWSLFLSLPMIGTLYRRQLLLQYLYALEILLRCGMSIMKALCVARGIIVQHDIELILRDIESRVGEGSSLLAACSAHESFFPPAISKLIALGEQTGNLPLVLHSAAALCKEELKNKIERYTFFLQPLLLLGVGIFIAGMLVALYGPLMNNAYTVG